MRGYPMTARHAKPSEAEHDTKSKGFINVGVVKNIKKITFFLVAPLGVVGIVMAAPVKNSDKFNMSILWLSGIAVAAYTFETYELRKTSENQLSLQRDMMMNEFLPIIVPSGEGAIQNGKVRLNVINCGKGVAKDVEVKFRATTIAKCMAIMNDSAPVTLASEEHADEIREALKKADNKDISLSITYRDIYEREVKTVDLKFKKQTRGRTTKHVLRRLGWQYQAPGK